MVWIEMLNEYERHPGICWDGLQKLAEGLKASGRCSYADYWACFDVRRLGVAPRLYIVQFLCILPAIFLRKGVGTARRWRVFPGFIRLGHVAPVPIVIQIVPSGIHQKAAMGSGGCSPCGSRSSLMTYWLQASERFRAKTALRGHVRNTISLAKNRPAPP